MDRTRIMASAALCAVFASSTVLAQPADKPAAAEPAQADLDKAKEHFAKGKELFDKKDFDAAVEEFKESYRLSKNPLLLYNIGFTLDQLGQRALALFYYQKFVAAVPGDNPNVAPAKERIDVLQREIEDASLTGAPVGGNSGGGKATGGSGGKATTGGDAGAADAARPVTKFEHAVVDAAPPGKPVDIGAFVPAGNFQATLFFRAAGEAKFASTEMKPRYNERVGRIPAERTRTATVQYYIEVRDESGQIVERSGKSTSPNLIFIENEAPPHYYADLGDDKAYHQDTVVTPTYSGGGRVEGTGPAGSGWFDAGSRKFTYLKWGTTGTAVGMLAIAATSYLVSSSAASTLEDQASSSISEPCPSGPPCRKFSGDQQDLEVRGERFENIGNVTLGIGAAAAVAAGVFWYLDLKDRKGGGSSSTAALEADEPRAFTATPVVTPDFVGGAAALRF